MKGCGKRQRAYRRAFSPLPIVKEMLGNAAQSVCRFARLRFLAPLGRETNQVDPVISVPFTIASTDAVATAGSCFAQYIAHTLAERGFNYLVTEPGPLSPSAIDENYGVFPARFGNIYNTKQLVQLSTEPMGGSNPPIRCGRARMAGSSIPFGRRSKAPDLLPQIDLFADREAHLGAVRRMFEACSVFIFTLGLTEAWLSDADSAAVPVAPGVVGSSDATYRFCNLPVSDMAEDLVKFIDRLRQVNPTVRIILTVSPVPLIATYENRHVLV